MSDWLPPWVKELEKASGKRRLGQEILFLAETDSTNLRARDYALGGAKEGLVVLADFQSQGKGRMGRIWKSPPGVNLYLSVVLRPPIPLARAPQLTLLAGVSGAKALTKVSGLRVGLKWPNDLLLDGKKVAGILAEMTAEGPQVQFLILGIGVNVNWKKEDIPLELRETATSLRAATGREFSRTEVGRQILEELEREYVLFLKEGFSPRLREDWNRLSVINQKWVTVAGVDKSWEGEVLGLDTDGALLVRDREGKSRRLIAGEVSLRF